MCTSSLTALKRQFELKQWTSGNSNLESRQSDLFLHHNSQASSQD
jgi:hypothetical protein